MDGKRFMDIPFGNPNLCIGLTIVLCWFWISFVNSSGRHKLKAFPTAGSIWPVLSFLDTVRFITNAQHILDSGLRKWPGGAFKVRTPIGWWVVVTDLGTIEDLRTVPEHVVSAKGPNEDALQVVFTLGAELIHNPYHIPLVRTKLNKALPKLWADLHDELEEAFRDHIPATDDWTSIKALDTSMKILARSMNRILVGLPLCRDPDWIRLNTVFTKDVAAVGLFLLVFPAFLRPLINYMITPVHRHRRNGLKHLAPIIAARRKEREEKGDSYPVDFLTWLMDETQEEENQDEYLLRRIFALNFPAIHTTSMTFVHALYYLALYPDYWSALREEVEELTTREGWTKAAVDQMCRIDSFVKDFTHSEQAMMVLRKTVGEYTLSNGTKVPPGVTIAVPSITHDPEVFDDPLTFDGFRFVKMKGHAVMDGYPGKKFDIVTTNTHSLNFGYGGTACPGQFLAAAEVKMMLAYVVVTYDVKLVDGVRPSDWSMMHICGPNLAAEVLFRKRRDPNTYYHPCF